VNTTGAISRTGTIRPSEAPDLTSNLLLVFVLLILQFLCSVLFTIVYLLVLFTFQYVKFVHATIYVVQILQRLALNTNQSLNQSINQSINQPKLEMKWPVKNVH
jgi:uncharacterized membrane protein YagU involved in acid resistance